MSAHDTDSRLKALALGALGVVYGDIGTSPLYAIKEVFGGSHHPVPINHDNVLGILSLIFWSLMVVVSLKYVWFILRADNKGEGGIMALMALALRPLPEGTRRRGVVLVLGLFGAALFYGDGVITPAISVLSAVEGLGVATPALAHYILPVSLCVLVGLFMVQRHGTAAVGILFGPVMVVWFISLGALGIAGIANNPEVLQALNPLHAVRYLMTQPAMAFFSLGAAVLTLTGAEALYADMGHFGRKPIQLAWFGLVLPGLVLNYFGQGALLLHDPATIENPFYLLAPQWLLYPLVALATVATVIASQAVISGAYSITQQAIQLGYAPRMAITHTSDRQIGQIYLPAINWMLLLSVVALVIGYGSSSRLAAAYGIAVTGTMLITDLLAYVVARHLWGWSPLRALLGTLPFVAIDTAYLAANATKIADGGWFPLLFGACVFLLLSTWKRGRQLLTERLESNTLDMKDFATGIDGDLPRLPGTAVFLTPTPDRVPQSMLHTLKHFKALHERVVLVSVQIMDVPHIADTHRIVVERISDSFWKVKVFYGFMEHPDLPEALAWCADSGLDLEPMETSFFLGRETLVPGIGAGMRAWREKLFVAMFRNAGDAASFFRLPENRVVELGTRVAL